jgi:aryl-alcohol dehydrogenase-like predicted oxidoreductase
MNDSELTTRRDKEIDLLPVAMMYGMAIGPWSTLGSGRFKVPDDLSAIPAVLTSQLQRTVALGHLDSNFDEAKYSRAFYAMGEKRGIISFAPIALAYVMAIPASLPNHWISVRGSKCNHMMI